MERRQPEAGTGKADDNEPARETEEEIKPATWAVDQAGASLVPAPRVSMELLERVAFLLRRY
jgi:hypothetical protein